MGKHPFSHFVSTDKKELKFGEIEQEMLTAIQPSALSNYGIDIKFLGIKQLKLPESVTQKVFDRMIAERQREIDNLRSQGEAQAIGIRSAADLERDRIRATADAEATAIKGQADAAAAKSYAAFEQNPSLAIFIRDLRALEEVTKDRTTLILDERTRPFNLLTRPATNPAPVTRLLAPAKTTSPTTHPSLLSRARPPRGMLHERTARSTWARWLARAKPWFDGAARRAGT